MSLNVYEINRKNDTLFNKIYNRIFGPRLFAYTTNRHLAKSFIRSHTNFDLYLRIIDCEASIKFLYRKCKELICYRIFIDEDDYFLFVRRKDVKRYIRKGYTINDSLKCSTAGYSTESSRLVP